MIALLLASWLTAVATACGGSTLSAVSGAPTSTTIKYSSGSTKITVQMISDFFTNSDETNCPMTCTLYATGCSNAYSGSYVIIQTSDMSLRAKHNSDSGYTHNLCISCATSQQTLTHDWVFQQRCKCCDAYSVLASPQADLSLSYDSSTTTQVISHAFNSFFESSIGSGCSTTNCYLKQQGCTATYSGTNVAMETSSNWDITVKKNINAGYDETFCIQCLNSDQTVNHDNWRVQQSCGSSSLTSNSFSNQEISYNTASSPQNIGSGYSSFFSTGGGCPITSCTLKNNGCSQTYTGSNVVMGSSSPWQITAISTVQAGYSVKVCVSCSNSQQTIEHGNYKITQTASPVSCTGQLTVKGSPLADQVFSYDAAGTQENVGSGWSSMFDNGDTSNCPITSCTLYASGCSGSVSNSKLTMESSDPWQIKITRNSGTAYTQSYCVSCSGSGNTITRDNWQIQQTYCPGSLSAASSQLGDQSFSYSSSSSTKTLGDSSSFFQNSDSTNCAISSCSILPSGCSGSYSGGKISVSGSSPFSITATQNDLAGWTETVCFQCTNGVQTIQKDNWVVTQAVVDPSACTISTSQTTLEVTLQNTGTTYQLQYSDFNSWFQLATASSYTGTCEVTAYAFYQDAACTTASTSAELSVTGTPITSQVLNIATSSPTASSTVYFCATNTISNKASRQINYLVCGYESVSLTQSSVALALKKNEGTSNKYTYSSSSFTSLFQTNQTLCPLTTYALYSLNGATYSLYTSSDASLDSESNLIIDTSAAGSKDLYIKGSTASNQFTYFKIQVEIEEEVVIDTSEVSELAQAINMPPFFLDIPVDQTFTVTDQPASFSYALPTYDDAPGDTVTLSYSSGAKFINYDDSSNSIIIQDVDATMKGSYTVTLTLTDQKQGSKDYSFQVELLVEEKEEEEEEQEEEKQEEESQAQQATPGSQLAAPPGFVFDFDFDYEEPEDDPKAFGLTVEEVAPAVARIKSISTMGLMEISFEQEMNPIQDLSLFNSSNVRIWIIPAVEDDEGSQNFEFTWEVKSFTKYEMQIKLNFSSPESISPGIDQDGIGVNLRKVVAQGLLFSPTLNKSIDRQYRVLYKNIRKQMADSAFTQTFVDSAVQLGSTLQGILIGTFVMNTMFPGAASLMVSWINSLQILIHLPMLYIIIPANVSQFFGVVIPIVTFDILDPEYTTMLVLDFDEDRQEELNIKILDQMEDLGYDSHNSILNLGSLAIFTVIYFIKVAFLFIVLKPFNYFTGRGTSLLTSLQESLFYGEIIFLTLESYFEFLIAGILNIQEPLSTENGEIVSNFISWYSVTVTLVVIPLVCVFLLTRSTETLNEEGFKQKWEGMYDRIDARDKLNIWFTPIFCIRRLIFLAVVFNLYDVPSIQLIILMLVNLLILEFITGRRPLAGRFINRLEVFNEVNNIICTFQMAFFTAWIPSPSTQYLLGWSMIGSMMLSIAVNQLIIFHQIGKDVFLVIKKYYKRLRHKLGIAQPEADVKSQGSANLEEEDNMPQRHQHPVKKLELEEIKEESESSLQNEETEQVFHLKRESIKNTPIELFPADRLSPKLQVKVVNNVELINQAQPSPISAKTKFTAKTLSRQLTVSNAKAPTFKQLKPQLPAKTRNNSFMTPARKPIQIPPPSEPTSRQQAIQNEINERMEKMKENNRRMEEERQALNAQFSGFLAMDANAAVNPIRRPRANNLRGQQPGNSRMGSLLMKLQK